MVSGKVTLVGQTKRHADWSVGNVCRLGGGKGTLIGQDDWSVEMARASWSMEKGTLIGQWKRHADWFVEKARCTLIGQWKGHPTVGTRRETPGAMQAPRMGAKTTTYSRCFFRKCHDIPCFPSAIMKTLLFNIPLGRGILAVSPIYSGGVGKRY